MRISGIGILLVVLTMALSMSSVVSLNRVCLVSMTECGFGEESQECCSTECCDTHVQDTGEPGCCFEVALEELIYVGPQAMEIGTDLAAIELLPAAILYEFSPESTDVSLRFNIPDPPPMSGRDRLAWIERHLI